MDERHWWFASKLQETFHFGGYDNPTLLEDFLSESDVVDLINKFLSPGGPRKLFFYCDAAPLSSHCSPVPNLGGGGEGRAMSASSRHLHLVSQLTRDVLAQGCVCLYVLRRNMEAEVDVSQMEKELFSGELRHSVLSSLATLLAEAYNPLLHSQKNWRDCSDETIANFLQNFNKFSNSLTDSATKVQMYQPLLQRPSRELKNCLVYGGGQDGPHRGLVGGGGRRGEEVGEECEVLVGDWVGTIESLLIDAMDERLEDPNGSLLAELGKWQRRHTLISSVVEQLKSKECKTVLATLVANKSRLLKKWRTIDAQITDAFNTIRDRLRYLDALSPHFEPLQVEATTTPTLCHVTSTILPALMATMKQMESVSRVYAKSGYLGILCIKLCNSLVRLCAADLDHHCAGSHNQFWQLVSHAIQYKAQPSLNKPTKDTAAGKSFIAKLESYVQLSATFKSFLSQLKDNFLLQHVNFSLTPVNKKISIGSTAGMKKAVVSAKSTLTEDSVHGTLNQHLSGVSLHNTDRIMFGMNSFISQVANLLELVSTLAQFTQLNLEQRLTGLPRFAGLWSLQILEGSEAGEQCESLGQSFNQSEGASVKTGTVAVGEGGGSVSDITLATPDYLDMLISRNTALQHQLAAAGGGGGGGGGGARSGGGLHSGALSTLREEGSCDGEVEEQDGRHTQEGTVTAGKDISSQISASPDAILQTTPTPSQSLQSTSYQASPSLADSLGLLVQVSLKVIRVRLELDCGGGVVEMFGVGGAKSGTVFSRAYQEYAVQVEKLDTQVCSYLKALFFKPMPSSRALDYLSQFSPISSRPAIKEALERSMLTAFNRYARELEEIQDNYERNKGSPVVSRNLPPVTEAVLWARQLLRKVEQPMQVFRTNTTVMQSVESLHVCKLHNRLAAALLKYETLWLERWRAAVESGRGTLKAPLLVQESNSGQEKVIRVNCSQEMLELLAESKALARLGIPLPEVAQNALNQEARVKHFKQQLEHVLEDFYSTKSSIDPALLPLMTPHVEGVVRTFLPGWTTWTWSTMNIDAFLHQVERSVGVFKSMVDSVKEVLRRKVYGTLELIRDMALFDGELAASRMWQPQQFVEIIMSSIIDRSNKLLHNISIIRTALLEIVQLTTPPPEGQQTNELHPFLPLPLIKDHTPAESSSSTVERRAIYSNKSTPQRSGHASIQHFSSPGTTVLSITPTHDVIGQLGPVAEGVIVHFCELTFDTVNKMVLRSHDLFSNMLWSPMATRSTALLREGEGQQEADKRPSRVVSFNVPDSPEKVESLAEVVKHDELQGKINSLLSALQTRSSQHQILQLVVDITFSTPRVMLEPSLDEVYSQLMDVSSALVGVLRHIKWWLGPSMGRNLYDMLELNGVIRSLQSGVLQAIQGVSPSIEECLQSLRLYDFLWQQDLHSSYQLFLRSQPGLGQCSSHVHNFMELESKIEAIPTIFSVGPLQLSAKPVKNSFQALAVSWKVEFTQFIHQQAKGSLDSLVSECADMVSQLQTPVETLAQLKSTLQLLHHITDMQNVVDDLYLPVERQYDMLREFNPHLPRAEIQRVDTLRDKWSALISLAEEVRTQLLSIQRQLFEREVDKQVKGFVVETIQFRNSFDTEGPLVPGLRPNDAVSRLGMFLDLCEELKGRRDLLGSVQKLLDIPLTPYPELDQTEQDLSYLRALYKNYQHFLTFDKKFRQILWNEVDLDASEKEIESFWQAYKSLPVEQQEWDASRKLCSEIGQYRAILPLLKQLHSKEIHNRHWLQVMTVANCTFQLEGSIFKMAHLLDAGLLHHVSAIQEIVHCAQLELQLEEKFFSIQEEWSEQNLRFQHYKSHGPILLDIDHTHSLLEQLEHAQMELANMLMSRHIQPLKEEAIQWAAKLSTLADILQQWLLVQKLWNNLEAVFNSPKTVQEFAGEAVKFASTHKRWIKLMKRAHEVKNTLQCCFGTGELSQSLVLSEIRQQLEECRKSLSTYLQTKRENFPRFFYVSDDSLLSILSNPMSVTSIQPHLLSLFGAIVNLMLTTPTQGEPPLITAVESVEGEKLELLTPVPLSSGVEQWAGHILSSVHSTLQHHILSPACSGEDTANFSLEDIARTQVHQVASLALFFQWRQDCDQGLLQCRYDRRALPGVRAKFNTWSVSRLVTLLMRSNWKTVEEPITAIQRASLEALAMLSLWLRDVIDDLCHRKLRDITDFEWQRFIRPYLTTADSSQSEAPPSDQASEGAPETSVAEGVGSTVMLQCLDRQIEYGYEYLGCSSLPVLTARANNYIIAFTQSSALHLGSLVTGPTGAGKVQLIKGIGQICGRNVLTQHCSPLMCGPTLLRLLEGVVREGSWAALSDVDTLPAASLSVLSQMMQLISTSLQAKRASFSISSNKEVSINPGLAVFLTSSLNSTQWPPPPSLSPHMRTFSFAIPDPTMVVRAHCTALGLKAPKALANKLVTLQHLANQQLSINCPQAQLSTSTLCHILRVSSRLLMAPKTTPTNTTITDPQTSTGKQHLSPERASSQGQGQGSSSGCEYHGTGRTPGHESKSRGKVTRMVSSYQLSPTAAGQPLPGHVMKEHAFVAQVLLNVVGARLPTQELTLFTMMVREVFAGSAHNMRPQSHLMAQLPAMKSAQMRGRVVPRHINIPELLQEEATKSGLVPTQPWLRKVEQLYSLAQIKHAVVVAGKPATGKSTAISTVVSTLCSLLGNPTGVKLMRFFPRSMENTADIFGWVNPDNGDWEDGIFTNIFRKAHKATQSITWLCLDSSTLNNSWMQYLPELLGNSRTLTLGNGEHLSMNEDHFKLLFETGDLGQASPAALLNTGIVYFGSDVLGWRPVVKAWLSDKNQRESQCLHKYFEQTVDSIAEFVLQKSGQSAMYSEVGLMETCLAYLTTLLNSYSETAEVFSEVHIERLLLFSLIWSYGGVLVSNKEKLKFSHLLKTLTNSLPDDDSQSSVFDYYVDESGEWDVWQSRVPLDPVLQVDMLGSVYVDTIESIRVEVLLELALAGRRHTLLVGPHGCGKTTICKRFLQSRALSNGSSEVLKQLVMDGCSKSDVIQNFMGTNFHHRQGYTYGPKHGKLLQCFLDDLHLPLRHTSSTECSSHDYLRQLMDLRGMYSLQRRNEWSVVEDFVIFACLTSNSDALLSPRLRRHMAVIHLPSPSEGALKVIASQQLQALLEAHSYSIEEGGYEGVLEASVELYSKVRRSFKVSDTPGRCHYFFSLKNLVSVFQGLCQCITSGLSDMLSNVWTEEVKRAFSDGVCRTSDLDWIYSTTQSLALSKIASECVEGEDESSPHSPKRSILAAISPEIKQGNEQSRSSPSPLNTLPEVNLVCLKQLGDLHLVASHYLRRYREERGDHFDLELSDNNLSYLVKLHRALKFSVGHCILVGSLGQQLSSLSSFALFLAGYEQQSIDFSREGAFADGLKSLFRQAGLEGKQIGVIINENNLEDLRTLQALNSIITCGELPTLFSNDELEGLLQALSPSIKRDFPSEETDPMQYFVARLFRNLRFIICLSPTSPLLTTLAHDFKGMLQNSQLIWMRDWTKDCLINTASHFFANSPLTADIDDNIKYSLMDCLAAIHCFMMQETQQLLQAGFQPSHLLSSDQYPPPSARQLSSRLEPPPGDSSEPTAYSILVEKVLKMNKILTNTQDIYLPYIGPRTYLQFFECFSETFHLKHSKAVADRDNLSKALTTLTSIRKQAEEMKTTLKELKLRHEESSKLADSLLKSLTSKSCQLEKLKALMGQSSSVLSAMQMVSEQERQLVENEEDDEELLALFMDKQTTRLETLLVRAKEQVRVAEEEEREAKKSMIKSKETALHWHNKIDRNSIDQIKSLNSPPRLVGTIMELMLTLLKQYGVDPQVTSASEGSSASTPGHVIMSKKKKPMFSTSAQTSKIDKEHWNSIQLAIGDSQNFLDLLNGLKWQDGLSTDAVNLVLSKLAIPGKNVPLSTAGSKSVTPQVLERSTSSAEGKGLPENLITVSMARHAAESAANMCAFVVSIVEYNDSFKPFKLAAEKLLQAQQELSELEAQVEASDSLKTHESSSLSHPTKAGLEGVAEEVEIGEEGLQQLQQEVDQLQENFDKAVIEKHSLAHTCQQLAEKLKAANHLLESLKGCQESWQTRLEDLPQLDMLMADCILAAAVTVYCGPLNTRARLHFTEGLRAVCRGCGFPATDHGMTHVLKLEGFPQFMLGVPTLHKLVTEGLPPDSTSQQSAAIVMYPHSRAWPLVLDPLALAEQWLNKRETEAITINYQDHNLHDLVLKALENGSTLIITNVATKSLKDDLLMLDILKCRRSLHRAKNIVKLMIGDKEVECNPKFKLYLVSQDHSTDIPPLVASLVCTVTFHPEVKGLQEAILDSFLQLQNQKTSQDRAQLRVEIRTQAVKVEKVEAELLKVLVEQEVGHIEEPKAAKTVLHLNKAYEDAVESLTKAQAAYSLMNEVHLSMLRGLSTQAGIMVATVSAMSSILPAYYTSYQNILSVFLAFIEQAGSRIQGEDALVKMTRSAYSHFVKSYFEKDRLLFSFMLAEEIEISHGRASREEQGFLVSPSVGSRHTIRGLQAQGNTVTVDSASANILHFGKKPFDWMTDSQWQMLLMLASHFSWVHPILEKQGKDGKDAVWRTIGEGVAPEVINLAESLGYKLLPMQQLLLQSAMRPERIAQCMVTFVSTVLHQIQTVPVQIQAQVHTTGQQRLKRIISPVDFNKVAKTVGAEKLPVILFREEPNLAITKLQKFTTKLGVPLTVCYLHGNGEDEVSSAFATLTTASSQGHWVLLHNTQLAPALLSQLPAKLTQLPPRTSWKLWLSVQGDCDVLPPSLLHSANKIVLDPPREVCSSVLYCLGSLIGGVASSSSRPEWLPILHCMCMLHATVCLRELVYTHAWVTNSTWTYTHFMDAIGYMKKDFASTEATAQGTSGLKPVSWTGIRYMINEVIYGSAITDAASAATFSALTDHWIHTGGPKKEFGRYHIPAVFFAPNTRLSVLLHSVEAAHPPLVLTAELCGLYNSTMIKLGWKDYLFPKLAELSNYLQEHLPPTTPSPLTSLGRGDSADTASVLSMSRTTKIQPRTSSYHAIVEKLPSFIPILWHVTEVNLSHMTGSLLASLRASPSLLKDLPLQSNVDKLVEKMPTIWKKEVIMEKLKRHGVDTPFGMFMKSEVTRMSVCMQAIVDDLKELHSALSPSSTGDVILESPQLVELSLSLLTSTVPQSWLTLVGPSAPPSSWPLKEWLQDLILRCSFLDRVLSGGLGKTATYWLGAFFNPAAFLNIIQQSIVWLTSSRSGAVEQFVFHAEMTNRDKDHIRDPPPEGELFVYGAYLWGCSYEKSANTEFQDIAPKHVPVSLPVLHLSASVLRTSLGDQPSPSNVMAVEHKGPQTYPCPCFVSHSTRRAGGCGAGGASGLFTVSLVNSDSSAISKWATRNLACTLRPF